jgi:lactoylglutathione lyase
MAGDRFVASSGENFISNISNKNAREWVLNSKFTYVGIRVKDVEKSIDFYTGVLGMRIKGRSKMEQTKGETVGLESEEGGFVLELNHYERDSPYYTEYVVGEGLDHLAFSVEDLTKALERARASGYRVISEMKTDGSRWAYVEDPNGIWIELF